MARQIRIVENSKIPTHVVVDTVVVEQPPKESWISRMKREGYF
jgi:hypothetical protein|tara:strand:+ start:371 stop:499 length:129 start_codon:yes stop_codon:yes gene_type:complete